MMECSGSYSAIKLILKVVISFFLVESSWSFNHSESNLNSDIQQLAKSMPGCYSNAKQYYAYAMKAGPYHKQRRNNLFLLRAEFYRMESPLFNDSLTIYFQDFTKSSKTPFSSGFYSFTPDSDTTNIRMKVYLFKEPVPGLQLPFSNYSIPGESPEAKKLVEAFHDAQLRTHTSCDMLWKKVSNRTFIGVTRSACLASLGKESVRVSVSMTLTGSRITLTEGWYNIDDRTELRELKVPYVLKRKLDNLPRPIPTTTMSSPEPKLKPVKMYNSRISLKTKQNGIRENLNTYHKLRVNTAKRYINNSNLARKLKSLKPYSSLVTARTRKSAAHSRKRKVLRSYRQIKASLMSARSVFYKVDLSKCSMPQQVPVNRLSFGGRIEKFLIIREKRSTRKRTKIYFSTSRASMSYRGVESMHREMTLHRGGRVEVKVTKQIPGRVPTQYTFQCKLVTGHKGSRGGVALFADPSVNPKKAKNVHKMTSSLRQGRELWLVTDVSGCQGGRSDTIVTVGSAISDHDLVNNGRILEVFLPLDRSSPQVSQGSPLSGFEIKIFKNGDVILTWVSATNEETNSKRVYSYRSSYRCELTNHLGSRTNNEAGEGSVNVFYR